MRLEAHWPASSPPVWKGIDLQAEAHRLVQLEIVPAELRVSPPLVHLHLLARNPRIVGYAHYSSGIISLYASRRTGRAEILGTLAHEIAHLWRGEEARHDESWRMALVELVREGFHEEPDMPVSRATWALDVSCETAVHRALHRRRSTVKGASWGGASPC